MYRPKGVIFEEYEVRELKKWEAEYLHRVSKCKLMSKVIHKLNKGGEEVKPYLEMQVVKVKKDKPKQKYCPCCGGKIEMEKPIGNWVNGENLDKIKFPVPCSYMDGLAKKIGMFNKVFFRGEYFYLITDCSQQYNDSNGEQFYHPSNLKRMFEDLNIHILKGKIIIFEEE